MGNVYGVCEGEPDVAVHPRPRVPSRSLFAVVHTDGKKVWALFLQVRRQVVLETDVAVPTVSEMVAVDPDVAVLVDTVELDEYLLAPGLRLQREMLSIPSNAAR